MSDVSLNEQPEAARVEIVADPASHGGWHLDRRVPAALIIAVMIQTGGIVWWAASLSAANSMNASSIISNKIMIDKLDDRTMKISNDMAEVKATVDNATNSLNRQTDKLDSLISKIITKGQ